MISRFGGILKYRLEKTRISSRTDRWSIQTHPKREHVALIKCTRIERHEKCEFPSGLHSQSFLIALALRRTVRSPVGTLASDDTHDDSTVLNRRHSSRSPRYCPTLADHSSLEETLRWRSEHDGGVVTFAWNSPDWFWLNSVQFHTRLLAGSYRSAWKWSTLGLDKLAK